MIPYTNEESDWLSQDVSAYRSDRVFDGTRSLTGIRLTKLKEKRAKKLEQSGQ